MHPGGKTHLERGSIVKAAAACENDVQRAAHRCARLSRVPRDGAAPIVSSTPVHDVTTNAGEVPGLRHGRVAPSPHRFILCCQSRYLR